MISLFTLAILRKNSQRNTISWYRGDCRTDIYIQHWFSHLIHLCFSKLTFVEVLLTDVSKEGIWFNKSVYVYLKIEDENKYYLKTSGTGLNPYDLSSLLRKYHLKWSEEEQRHISTKRKREIISTKSQNLRTDGQMVTDLEDWIYLKPRFKMGEAIEKKSNSYHKIPDTLRNWVSDPSKVGTENKTSVEPFCKKFLRPLRFFFHHSQPKNTLPKPLEKRGDLIFENVEQKMRYVLYHKIQLRPYWK